MPASASETAVQRLARELAGDVDDDLAADLERWMDASRRFRAFAVAHQGKIRKKLRVAVDDDSRLDVWTELRTAQLLLADRRIDLAFEPHGATLGGPDFTVTLRGATPFNLEVTRVRGDPATRGLGRSILAKLRQLPPSIPNALLIAIESDDAGSVDVAADVRGLRARADSEAEPFFTAHGFAGRRGFYERFLRLGGVITWCDGATGDARAAAWQNASARIPLSEPSVRACLAALRAG